MPIVKIKNFFWRNIRHLKKGETEPLVLAAWFPVSIPLVVMIRLIRPWLLVRFSDLYAHSMGMFSYISEIYLSRRDMERKNYKKRACLDFFFMGDLICNRYLVNKLHPILPLTFRWPYSLFRSLEWVNRKIPQGEVHHIGLENIDKYFHLMDSTRIHLQFSDDEVKKGETELEAMGVPVGSKIVCLLVRDNAYIKHQKSNYDDRGNDYRNCDIDNYILAAETLADYGYVVIRMGAKMSRPLKTVHPNIIDYSFSGFRNDFMDTYLGSKCEFSITMGCGWDVVPSHFFRKPIVYTNLVPLGYYATYSDRLLLLTKRHFDSEKNRELTVSELIRSGLLSSRMPDSFVYQSRNIKLIENSPEEIRDAVFEMVQRLNGTWKSHSGDEVLQTHLWDLVKPAYSGVKARFGACYLRDNREWLR